MAYLKVFQKDESAANVYLTNADTQKELAEAFDKWVTSSYQPKRSSLPYLHYAMYWFFKAGDRERVKKITPLVGSVMVPTPWDIEGPSAGPAAYGQAIQMAYQ
jgi:hypothetical protein